MANQDTRFEIVVAENHFNTSFNIIVDKQTGVNYFWARGTMGAGMSPLYDANGNIIVTKPENKSEG